MVGGGEGLRQGDNQVSSLVVDHISVHEPTHGVCCVTHVCVLCLLERGNPNTRWTT